MQDPFQFLKNCYTKELQVTSKKNQFKDYYVVTKALSLNSEMFYTITKINELAAKLPKWAVGCLLFSCTTKMNKAPYIPYYLKKGKGVNEKYKELLQVMAKHYCCSMKHVEQIYKIFERHGINAYEKFGVERKK